MNFLSIPVSKHDHILGSGSAPCSLVEYGDYECPSCRAFQPIFKALSERFGDQLSLVFRNFPLSELHPNAEEAAEVAELSGSYGSFWTAHDMLFADQQNLGRDTYRTIFTLLALPDFEHWPTGAKAAAKRLISADFAGVYEVESMELQPFFLTVSVTMGR